MCKYYKFRGVVGKFTFVGLHITKNYHVFQKLHKQKKRGVILHQHAKSFQTSYGTHLKVTEHSLFTGEGLISTKKCSYYFQAHAIARMIAFIMLMKYFTTVFLSV